MADSQIFSDKGALQAELSQPGAFKGLTSLCSEATFVNPKLVTLRTQVSPEDWQATLEDSFARDPLCSALKIRWRASRGSRIFAVPAASAQQLSAARRRAGAKKTATALDQAALASVSFSRPLGADSQDVCLRVLQVLRDRGMDFKAEEDPRLAGPMSWTRLRDGPSGVVSRMTLAFHDQDQAGRARHLLHDKAFKHGEDLLAISFADDGEMLQAVAKNGGRQGRGR